MPYAAINGQKIHYTVSAFVPGNTPVGIAKGAYLRIEHTAIHQ